LGLHAVIGSKIGGFVSPRCQTSCGGYSASGGRLGLLDLTHEHKVTQSTRHRIPTPPRLRPIRSAQ